MEYLPPPDVLGLPAKFTAWRQNQAEAINKAVHNDRRVMISVCPTGFGKCHGKNTPILMIDGTTKPVQGIGVGDWVMGPDSKPREVLSVSSGFGPLYKVTPTKGDPYIVNENHILALKLTTGRRWKDSGQCVCIPVLQYLQKSASWKYLAKGYRVGVRFSKREIPLDAYFIGLWLGDGSEKSPSVTTNDFEIISYLAEFADICELSLRFAFKKTGDAPSVFLTQGSRIGSHPNIILASLRALGISEDKHIPECYKLNDRTTRLRLLAGYLDADGHQIKGCFEFVSKSERLAADVCFVARSLGFACYVSTCTKKSQNGTEGTYFRGTISGDTHLIPTRIQRKRAKQRTQKKDVLMTGIRVESCGDGAYFGFTVDGDHKYLLGDFTVTHNSLMYVAASRLLGGKTIILTSTKGLQSQLMHDFEEIGMVDMRGKNAYRCALSDNTLSCDEAPCTAGLSCAYKRTPACTYYAALARARKANLVVTNYAFWFHANAYSDGIGMPNLLVCDEGHDAPEAVASFLTVEFNRRDEDLMQILPTFPDKLTIEDWKRWAIQYFDVLSEEVADLVEAAQGGGSKHFKRLARIRRTLQQLKQLATMNVDNWVCNPTATTIEFAPIKVSDRCQELLFEKSRHAILTSASICQKTGEMLGLSSEDCLMDEYPHTFPVENRLVIHVRGARMSAKSTGEDLKEWLKTIDRIIEGRMDRKGIIHTTSYMRRDFVMTHSKYAHLMMSHQRKDVVEMVRKFKESEPPRVFVSPAVTTGWDFPRTDCEFQIIGKVPYPDSRNVITRARSEADPDYAPYIAMQQLVQACGRGNRAEDDQCENFIVDDNITWFMRQNRKFAPNWFMESLTSRMFPPEAPTKLNRKGG